MKRKTLIAAFILSLCIGGNVSVFAADEFTDIQAVQEFEVPAGLFGSGETSDSGESTPVSTITQDGITYLYDKDTDSYIVSRGGNRREVILPDSIGGKSITAIGEKAFADCYLLEKIEGPGSITRIESQAFAGCMNLYLLNVDAKTTHIEFIAPDAFENVNCVIFCEYDTDYQKPSYLKTFAESHNFYYIYLADYTDMHFYNNNTLQYLYRTIVTYCSRNVSGSISVKSIEEPGEIRTIGHHAFQNCSKITEISLENGIREIFDYAFFNCTSLQKIHIPSSVTSISDTAFGNCPNITIMGKNASYAQKYAAAHGISFQSEDTDIIASPPTPTVTINKNQITITSKSVPVNAENIEIAIGKNADSPSKNKFYRAPQSATSGFLYVPKGTYYAFTRGISTNSNGTVKYGKWSAGKKFTVSAVTPSTPKITKVSVSGKTVKITYTKASYAAGYDVVLGKAVNTTAYGEKRPVQYGKMVKKATKGSTVTVIFKNVPKGTYYAGLHAYSRTGANNAKVFSPWSDIKSVKVK